MPAQNVVKHVKRTRVLGDCVHPYEPTEPSGYIGWHDWAEEYAKTHDQQRCPECGLWAIWTPKAEEA